jgi:hypothetical protein
MALSFAASYPERVRAIGIYGDFARGKGLSEELLQQRVPYLERVWGSGEVARGFAPNKTRDPAYFRHLARWERLGANPSAAIALMRISPGDPQPVFDLIVRRSTELCSVPAASLLEYDCELVHGRSYYNIETVTVPGSLEAARRQYPMPPTRGSINCRAILDRQIVHIRDMRAEIDLLDSVRALGHQSQVSVPLMRGNAAIGVISLGAHAPGGFLKRNMDQTGRKLARKRAPTRYIGNSASWTDRS